VTPTAAACPPDNCSWCFTLHTRASCQPSGQLRPVHRCLCNNRFPSGLRHRLCIHAYAVNAFLQISMHLFLLICMQAMHGLVCRDFLQAKKNPPKRVSLVVGCSASVHAPPEHMPKQADLLVLHLLEAVVLVGVFIAVETAQADAGRQAIHLLYPQLAVMVDGV
jgi:hypothetical protein